MQVEDMHCFQHHNNLLRLPLWSKSAIGLTVLSRRPLTLALSLALLLLRPSHSHVDVRNGVVAFLGPHGTTGDPRALAIGAKAFTVKGDERFGVSTVLTQL